MSLPTAWSYSSAKLFDNCPKKYYHLKVAKDYKEDDSAVHLTYGKDFHTAAEEYVRDGAALPEQFKYAKTYLDTLVALPGEKLCEFKMGLTEKLEPCEFFAKDCWYRGIADLVVLNREAGTARILDYKTSKSAKYADVGQLELMALCIFKHFPEVKSVKAGLLFVVCNEFKPAKFEVSQEHKYWANWMPTIARIERAHETDVWNPKKTGLCKAHCIILTCPHNGKGGR